ncbi:MAG: hypothetical protein JNK58_13710 [Phycisphaerae bacterium]|nr:hypothetical protein [Phycisphaerae bacterium]
MDWFMRRWRLVGVIGIGLAAGWYAFGPIPAWMEADRAVNAEHALPDPSRTMEPNATGDNPGSLPMDVPFPSAAASMSPDGPDMTCVDDESVLAPDRRRADQEKQSTRIDPKNVRLVPASQVALRRGPRLSAEYEARIQLELRAHQVFVIHELSSGTNFFVDMSDWAPEGENAETSLFEVYRLRTGHTIAIAFDGNGALLSVAYGEPNEAASDIPHATPAQLVALFDSPDVPTLNTVPMMEAPLAYQPRIVCGVSERFRIKRSGETEVAKMTVECIAGPSANPSEFFILPLTP